MLLILMAACSERAKTGDSEPAQDREALVLGGPGAPATIGTYATAPDYRMSVEGVEDCTLSPPFESRGGHRLLAVDVVLEGTTQREVPVNLFYAHLQAKSGDTFEARLAGCPPVLEARRIVAGQSARGRLTFEVPLTARHLELVYAPLIIGGGREELRFDLGR
jgi:hypothetical protein